MVNCNMQVQSGSHKLKHCYVTLFFSLHACAKNFFLMPKLTELEVRDQGVLSWLRSGALGVSVMLEPCSFRIDVVRAIIHAVGAIMFAHPLPMGADLCYISDTARHPRVQTTVHLL
jgi:hypothetical protein